ncbi:DUF572-domain-containing protein [Durotheca rogersii]|uniref:DUF572-domain-containing protein n=1 Tax=Durotheca rogersii TaxID=419775 RepID=UPI0022211CA6|nr:DUF572-domain-containing protein [Durotheca rogersii]KAI5862887.1 DUF572-domain-containing protein [Durotheca rogersii]
MSERKVLTKYYPPDFDPSQIKRARGPKTAGPKVQTVRLAAPLVGSKHQHLPVVISALFLYPQALTDSLHAEYIYKGRKFNARKETPPDEKYLGIQIFRFYIRCTRCSAQITFKTDPKNQDYACESGAKRSTEPWRVGREETDEERLDRLEKEEEERNAMVELEAKTVDAKREMAVADALDEIRTRNARMERANQEGEEAGVAMTVDSEAERLEREDAEMARRAFAFAKLANDEMEILEYGDGDGDGYSSATSAGPSSSASSSHVTPEPSTGSNTVGAPEPKRAVAPAPTSADMPPPSFRRVVKKKKDHSALLGIKKKPALT